MTGKHAHANKVDYPCGNLHSIQAALDAAAPAISMGDPISALPLDEHVKRNAERFRHTLCLS